MGFKDKSWVPSYSVVLSEYEDEEGNTVQTCMDNSTGEIVDYVVSKGVVRDISYPPPIDISTINSKEIFDHIIKQRVGKKRYQLWVGSVLLDLVVGKQYHPSVFGMFCYLGQSIKYNNMVYTNTKEMGEGAGYNRDTVRRVISQLIAGGLIKDVGNKLENPIERLFLVNPRYFFLGYYPYRNVLVKDWY